MWRRRAVTGSSTRWWSPGTTPPSRRRFDEHLEAGADHVAVQLIAAPDADLDAGFGRLAQILGLNG